MIKFINKVDGSVFYAEPKTIQFTVLKNDSNYEMQEEVIKELEEEIQKIEIEEEKPTKKKAAK